MALERTKRDRKVCVALTDHDWDRLERLLARHETRTRVVTTFSAFAYGALLAGLGVLEKNAEREQRHTNGT